MNPFVVSVRFVCIYYRIAGKFYPPPPGLVAAK